MAESLTISFCEHSSSPARYVALGGGGGGGGGRGGESTTNFSAELPDNDTTCVAKFDLFKEIHTLLVYKVFQHLLMPCICKQRQDVTINTNSWSSLSPAPSPPTLVSFPDYTPNNIQVGPRGRGDEGTSATSNGKLSGDWE